MEQIIIIGIDLAKRSFHLAEFGVIAPRGVAHVSRLASALADPGSALLGPISAMALQAARSRGRAVAGLAGA